MLLFNYIFATADFLNNPPNPPIVDGLLSGEIGVTYSYFLL
jgi:hypothetical protein